jgi:hemerythrin
MKFSWEEKYRTGIKEIDDQHKYFIELLNNYFHAADENRSQEEMKELFRKISDYAIEHFTTEEKYFDKFNFQEAEEHKLKHQEMLNEIKIIKTIKDKDDVDFSVMLFLSEWLDEHLEKMDQNYVECFKRHGM